MNAEALRNFDALAARTGEAMWPGTVVLEGIEDPLAVEVLKEPKLIGEIEEGGELEEGELVVAIQKELLAEKPARDTVLRFREKRYRIHEVRGEEEASARWLVEAERDS